MTRGQKIPFTPAPFATGRPEVAKESHQVGLNDDGKEFFIPAGQLPLGEWISTPFDGLPWDIEVKGGRVNGVWQIIGLKIECLGGVLDLTGERPRTEIEVDPKDIDPTITTDLLRQLPLRQLRKMVELWEERDIDPESLLRRDVLEPFTTERPPGGWGDDHYQRVADAYRNAKQAPTQAIADRWNVSRAAASKWIKEARKRRLLGYPTRIGVAGASAKKSPIKTKSATLKKGRK